MIEPGKLNGYLVAIKEELRKAEGKHPKFCDNITSKKNLFVIKNALACYRKYNDEEPVDADAVLHEEILEAIEAYLEGNKEHCLQELAQCGAVILRIMAKVDDEIQKEAD